MRIVHLGLGAFHRAHQAWYTAHAPDAADWGIAAFSGRSPAVAATLQAQDGLYTLVERGSDGDRDEIVESLVEAIDGSDLVRLRELFRSPSLAVVTLTITESGYRLTEDGTPDIHDVLLSADLDALSTGLCADLSQLHPSTTVGRLLLGFEERRRSGGGPIAIVSCDNLPENGKMLERGALSAARLVGDDLADWIAERVSFVSTSVDRITPRTTPEDIAALNARSARFDAAPVFTEPFADWVLSGAFPAGRPAWHTVGARFVDDIEPWERRKLWLLNGAHTLLSFAGPLRGHETVAAAIADSFLQKAVVGFWAEASRHLPDGMDLTAYQTALLERFSNPRIEHRLAQIAQDGARKLRLRIVPVAEAELAAGSSAPSCAVAIAAWVVQAEPSPEPLTRRLAELSHVLAADDGFLSEVRSAVNVIHASIESRSEAAASRVEHTPQPRRTLNVGRSRRSDE
ncbi:MAG TPA: mannitol dehydrogenase family protein [Pseudolysinimonas sp.]|nr:mannitol dehydrogenase family protein [Pseudolysinimonas sp.]